MLRSSKSSVVRSRWLAILAGAEISAELVKLGGGKLELKVQLPSVTGSSYRLLTPCSAHNLQLTIRN
jgi:hypothetical protein